MDDDNDDNDNDDDDEFLDASETASVLGISDDEDKDEKKTTNKNSGKQKIPVFKNTRKDGDALAWIEKMRAVHRHNHWSEKMTLSGIQLA